MLDGWQHMKDTTPEERTAAIVWVQQVTLSNPAYFYMNILTVAALFARSDQTGSAEA